MPIHKTSNRYWYDFDRRCVETLRFKTQEKQIRGCQGVKGKNKNAFDTIYRKLDILIHRKFGCNIQLLRVSTHKLLL